VPGLLIKSGAEGVQAFALADGRAGAVKIEDGTPRAIPAITVALLRILGADQGEGVDRAALDQIAEVPVLGGGQVVGGIRPVLPA
jgi:L-asparaginase II